MFTERRSPDRGRASALWFDFLQLSSRLQTQNLCVHQFVLNHPFAQLQHQGSSACAGVWVHGRHTKMIL